MAKQKDSQLIPDPRLDSGAESVAVQYQDEQPEKTDEFTTGEIKLSDREQEKGKLSGVPEHRHDDNDMRRVQLRELGGMIEVVTAAPANIPKNFNEQIKIYINAGTPELHVYDYVNQTWRVFT